MSILNTFKDKLTALVKKMNHSEKIKSYKEAQLNRRLNPHWCIWKICSKPLVKNKSENKMIQNKPIAGLYAKLMNHSLPFKL